MTQEELKIALGLHKKWLSNEPDGVKLDLRGEDLRGMDLSHANLSHVDLSYAKLSYANLTLADLSDSNLTDADLRFAILSKAYLSFSDLSDSNLIGANFNDADLRWTNTISTVGLDVICVQLNTSNQNRQIQYYVQLKKITAGCFSGTLDELKKAVDEKHDKDSVIYKRYQIALKTIEDILETY